MARLGGIDLPKNKRGVVGLTYIYGIGSSRAVEILDKADIDANVKVQDWTDDNIKILSKMLQDEYKI